MPSWHTSRQSSFAAVNTTKSSGLAFDVLFEVFSDSARTASRLLSPGALTLRICHAVQTTLNRHHQSAGYTTSGGSANMIVATTCYYRRIVHERNRQRIGFAAEVVLCYLSTCMCAGHDVLEYVGAQPKPTSWRLELFAEPVARLFLCFC